MKKKILGGLLVLAIAAVAAFNVNMNSQESELSLLALANVEALAQENVGNDRKCGTASSSTYYTAQCSNGKLAGYTRTDYSKTIGNQSFYTIGTTKKGTTCDRTIDVDSTILARC